MKKTLTAALPIVVTVLIVALLGVFFMSNDQPSEQQNQESAASTAAENDDRYVDYTSLDSSDEKPYRVLFFKADWCITCNALDKNIEENIAEIPEDTQVIRVDFDQETELKQKYDVRQQHTLVRIDSDGETVEKWALSRTLDDVLEKLERS